MSRRNFIITIVLVFLLVFLVYFEDLKPMFHKTSDLSSLRIRGFQIGDRLDSINRLEEDKSYTYENLSQRNYIGKKFKGNNELAVCIMWEKGGDRISYIRSYIGKGSKTEVEDIFLGKNIEEIVAIVGDKHYKIKDSKGQEGIGYIDKGKNIKIEFLFYDGLVYSTTLKDNKVKI